MFNKSGVSLIESAIGSFEKIANKLNEGVVACNTQIGGNIEAIRKAEQENIELEKSCVRAKKVLANLQPFLG